MHSETDSDWQKKNGDRARDTEKETERDGNRVTANTETREGTGRVPSVQAADRELPGGLGRRDQASPRTGGREWGQFTEGAGYWFCLWAAQAPSFCLSPCLPFTFVP